MTAIVGNKGMEHPYQCLGNNDGTNVLSVTFKPENLTLVMRKYYSTHYHDICLMLLQYSAWEKATGEEWRPAV